MNPTVALAIPAYNEAEGIAEFLTEIDGELKDVCGSLTMIVVDDASTDATSAQLSVLQHRLSARLIAERSGSNSGHGPTTLRAYQLALESGAEVILQVDGDGQFDGSDIREVLRSLPGNDVVIGVRRARTDPWFRRILTRSLRAYLRLMFKAPTADANSPLRAYRRDVLESLLGYIAPDARIPNVYLSALAVAKRCRVAPIPVRHRVRRGSVSEGSTWGRRKRFLVPRRLLDFVGKSLAESWRFRSVVSSVRRRGISVADATTSPEANHAVPQQAEAVQMVGSGSSTPGTARSGSWRRPA